jgi:hypothetical protein
MVSKKKILSIMVVFFMISPLLASLQPAYAANGLFGGGGFFSRLVDYIAQKFNLDKNQVQNAMTDFQKQEKANFSPRPRPSIDPQAIQDREKQRLDNLVKAGKITQDQENAIIAELASLREKYPFNTQNNLTQEQRKTQMQNMQTELKSWAQSNNIDFSYVLGGGFEGRKGGIGRGFWQGPKPSASPTSN